MRAFAAKVIQLRPSASVYRRVLKLCGGQKDGAREIGAFILG